MRFKIDVYSITVEVHLPNSLKDGLSLYKKLKKKLSLPEEGEEQFEGTVFLEPKNNSKAHIILCLSHISYNLVVHECSHLSLKIFMLNNIDINIGDIGEGYCLLNGYIAEKVFYILKKNNIMLYKENTPKNKFIPLGG